MTWTTSRVYIISTKTLSHNTCDLLSVATNKTRHRHGRWLRPQSSSSLPPPQRAPPLHMAMTWLPQSSQIQHAPPQATGNAPHSCNTRTVTEVRFRVVTNDKAARTMTALSRGVRTRNSPWSGDQCFTVGDTTMATMLVRVHKQLGGPLVAMCVPCRELMVLATPKSPKFSAILSCSAAHQQHGRSVNTC